MSSRSDRLRASPATASFLARHRRERVEPLTDRLVALIRAANPRYRADVVPVADLRLSCHDNIVRVLELLQLAVEGEPAEDEQYDAARATGRRRAEQGLPLDDVLRSFRFGGRLIWEDLVEGASDALDPHGLRTVGTHLWEVVDETSAQVALAYHETERARVRDDEQRRAELWEGLLRGRGGDPAFAHEAGRILDLPVSGDYLVVATGEALAGLPWRVLPGATIRWVRRSPGTVGVVLLHTSGAAEVAADMARRLPGAVGMSGRLGGLAGLERGLRQALLALRTQHGAAGVARFDDRLPDALLLTAPEVAARLLDLWLGPLMALPEGESVLLVDTLRHWVTAGGSTTRAAALAHCHRNTVLNRLARVSRLVGQDLAEGPPPLELVLALRALDLGTL